MSTNGGYNLGGINATGQIMEGSFSLVDKDTPQDVRTKLSPVDGRAMQLVFSDEFERDDRTFYPVSDLPSRPFCFRGHDRIIRRSFFVQGDDPYWEASDLYYWVSAALRRTGWD
jgi:beta-glucan synthesis-associated protein KRE6